MMTTLCAMMGPVPIALGLGAGAELRQPLGVVIVGGLAFSQVSYLWFDELATQWKRHGRRHAADPQASLG